MRKPVRAWPPLAAMLLLLGPLTACTQKEPTNAFEPMLQRLPAAAQAWLLVDAGRAVRHYESFWRTLKELPACKAQPELAQHVDDLRAIADGGLVLLKSKLGFDPLKDIERVAGAAFFDEEGKIRLVLVAKGKFPTEAAKRLFPEAVEEKLGEQSIFVTPADGPDLAFVAPDLLILADKGLLKSTLAPKALPKRLLEQHPGLRRPTGEDFVLRLSARAPEWLGPKLQLLSGQPGVSALMGLAGLELEWAGPLRLALAAKDDQAAGRAEDLLKALAELTQSGAWALRSAVQLALAAELEQLEELPGWLRAALTEPKAWLASMDELAPEPRTRPVVRRQGLKVELELEPRGLVGLAAWTLPIALPALLSADELAAQPSGAGGAP